jgi:predicted ATPase
LVGAPGTGKTTLAQALVLPLKLTGQDAVFVPEAARIFLRRSGPYAHWLEDLVIYLETVRQEEEMQEHEVLIYDNASFITAAYMQFHKPHNLTPSEQRKWEYCYRLLASVARDRFARFDQIFFVPSGRFAVTRDPDREWADDASRALGAQLESYLIANGISYHTVQAVGPQARLGEVLGVLLDRGLIDKMPPLVPKD